MPQTTPPRPGQTAASLEFELIRCGARATLGPQRAAAFRERAAGPIDWERVLSLGRHHRLLPLLYVHLRDHAAGAVPSDVLGKLRAYVQRTMVHVLFLTSETVRIANRFEADGVPYLVFKGPSLAEAYGSIGKRPFIDIDLFVPRAAFPKVERALLALKFNQRKKSDLQQSGYLSVHGEYTFGRQEDGFGSTVDVHTRLVPFGLSYAPTFEEMAARTRSIMAGARAVSVLSWEDLLLTLAINAHKDQWNRLRLATDLAEVATCVEDWPAVVGRATRDGCLRTLHLGLLVASDLVEAEFPEEILMAARHDRRAVRLAQDVTARLIEGRGDAAIPWSERVRLNMLVQDGLRGQLRYVLYAAVRRVTERVVDPRRPS